MILTRLITDWLAPVLHTRDPHAHRIPTPPDPAGRGLKAPGQNGPTRPVSLAHHNLAPYRAHENAPAAPGYSRQPVPGKVPHSETEARQKYSARSVCSSAPPGGQPGLLTGEAGSERPILIFLAAFP